MAQQRFFYQDDDDNETGHPRKDELVLVPYHYHADDAGAIYEREDAVDLSAFIGNQEVAAAHPELLEELLKPSRFMNAKPTPETTFQVLRHSTSSSSSGTGTPTSAPAYQTQSMLSLDAAAAAASASESANASRCTSPTTTATSKRKRKNHVDKNSDEYRKRRERNNMAVKKSREKSRQRSMETEQKVHELSVENQRLQNRIVLLTKELEVLKSLFASNQQTLSGRIESS